MWRSSIAVLHPADIKFDSVCAMGRLAACVVVARQARRRGIRRFAHTVRQETGTDDIVAYFADPNITSPTLQETILADNMWILECTIVFIVYADNALCLKVASSLRRT
jgi:hypothetical protein